VLPNDRLLKLIEQLDMNEALLLEGELIATRLRKAQFDLLVTSDFVDEIAGYEIKGTPIIKLENNWDIFQYNRAAIEYDFQLLTKGRDAQPISSTNRILAKDNVFLEEGAYVECAILNAQSGPIYVGRNATIMEGAILKGPVAVCEDAKVKMGARIYGPTTIGPSCKAGGEIKGSVMFAHSNKSHDGYMGDSVIAEWCNIGADTNTSNLKNHYSEIRMWHYPSGTFRPTGHIFCGLMMGDHSKTGINTMINTGTIIGVSSNVFGAGYPRTFIPSFSWGGNRGFKTYGLDQAVETAETVMGRRNLPFTSADKEIFRQIFADTARYRRP
jgi:UDP-N-acetylglucosamine diphosphorylase/glucosamine-1-phosphate N-acetyltransferase